MIVIFRSVQRRQTADRRPPFTDTDMLSLAMIYNKDLFDINKQNKISNVENIK